ncbi:aspartyl/asparaginyl beta-hydroxylase domain-containing protein [Bradyrhizobium sp. SZCCHNR1093]|uniref:aspartyl/asparaginyl beta-hydroxylase domain-containing protein n=1 Tax=Bradyrhizobium sp. SZCCHNR1093 TaxID=3057368 RepID=UPI0028E5A5DC|nr:aspartyl/asparaginyl beta-hydroxylase domain-containing protein [Bradyrhizobium sp. SZCCHNR1093]
MSKFADLVDKLDKIPHLDLGKRYDTDLLQTELSNIDPALFVPFRSKSRNAAHIAKFWSGLSLIAPNGSLHDDLTEVPYQGRTGYVWTRVAESSPYIKNIVAELGGEGQRVRIMRVQAGGSLTWHRHGSELSMITGVNGRRPNWYDLIVHVPIRTNPDFSYEVIDTEVYELADYSVGELRIHRKNYPAGEAWAFNSAHYHNVFNRSKTGDRYAIMLTLDIRMRKTFDIVSDAVERYIANGEGPLM